MHVHVYEVNMWLRGCYFCLGPYVPHRIVQSFPQQWKIKQAVKSSIYKTLTTQFCDDTKVEDFFGDTGDWILWLPQTKSL